MKLKLTVFTLLVVMLVLVLGGRVMMLRQQASAVAAEEVAALRAAVSFAPPTKAQQKSDDARQRDRDAEDEVRMVARRLRNHAAGADEGADQQKLRDVDRTALRNGVRQAFEARQDLLREEAAEFRKRLDRLSRTLDDRERAKDAIIDRRIEELLNPNLNWDAENSVASQLRDESGQRQLKRADSELVGTPDPTDQSQPVRSDSGLPPASNSATNSGPARTLG